MHQLFDPAPAAELLMADSLMAAGCACGEGIGRHMPRQDADQGRLSAQEGVKLRPPARHGAPAKANASPRNALAHDLSGGA